MVRHAIEPIHVDKNVRESLTGTMMHIPSKTKDTLKAWMDLEDMRIRKDLHHKIIENGSKKLPTLATL